jgi:hypothetical protein
MLAPTNTREKPREMANIAERMEANTGVQPLMSQAQGIRSGANPIDGV